MSDGNAPILNTPAWLQCEGKEPFASAMLAADHPLWSRVDRSGCPVLGIPLKSASGTGAKGSLPNSPSIDRIDNSRGYVRGNIVVVSMRANRIKHNATVEELEAVSTFYRKLADANIGGVFKP